MISSHDEFAALTTLTLALTECLYKRNASIRWKTNEENSRRQAIKFVTRQELYKFVGLMIANAFQQTREERTCGI
jgi:hypothetical protein